MKRLAFAAAILACPFPVWAQAPLFEIEGDKLDIRMDGRVRPAGWTLSREANPDILTVPIEQADGRSEACLLSGDRSYCRLIAVGERHDFLVRSGGMDYPTRFEGVYRPPMAVFDATYRAEHRGKIRVEIPEVYELVNVAIALTDYAAEKPGLVYEGSDYHAEILARFADLRDHPLVDALNEAMKAEPFKYFHYKMNAYAFIYETDGRIARSDIYDRTGFNGRPGNDLVALMGAMQDFSDRAAFREFYAAHADFYGSQVSFYRDDLDLAAMQDWLRREFPSIRPYDTTNVIFSPLVDGNQSVTWMTSNDFSELQPHVNFPWPSRNDDGLSAAAAALRRGYIVFTELNHGFINPTADRHRDRVLQAMGAREHWARPGTTSDSYGSVLNLFNELMNWGLVSLWIVDHAPAADQDRLISDLETYMSDRRGFPGFPAFNQALLELYRGRNAGETIEALYPRILDATADLAGRSFSSTHT